MKIKKEEMSKLMNKKMIALELPESLYQKLRKEAFDREVSLSAIVRYIVDIYFIDKEENN